MYIGQDLQVAYPTYKNIDDISGSFNGVTTSFALLVGGVAPSPLPLNSQQCLISVGGVIQRPDDTGSEGFRLSGGNIVFSSAPATGEDFFGVILAGADYVNVGANFPSGSAGAPSITFDSDLDTGIYNSAANQVSITTSGTERLRIDSAGQIEAVSLGTAAAPTYSFTTDANTGIYSPGADTVAISTNAVQRVTVDSTGKMGIGTASPGASLHVEASSSTTLNNLYLVNSSTAAVATKENTLAFRFTDTVGTRKNGFQLKTYAPDGGGNADNAGLIFIGRKSDLESEFARFDPSGRLLVGTSSTRQQASNGGVSSIQIEGTSTAVAGIQLTSNVNNTSGSYLFMGKTRATSNGGVTAVQSGDLLASLQFTGADGSSLQGAASIECYVDGTTGANDMPGRLVFSTTADGASFPTERMRINNSGQLLVSGTTAFGSGNINVRGPSAAQISFQDSGSTASFHNIGNWNSSSGTFVIQSHVGSGVQLIGPSATSWSGFSDIRLKNVTGTITDALIKIQQLEPITFTWKKDPGDKPCVGIAAHSIQPVLPEAIDECPDFGNPDDDTKYLSVRYTDLIPLLTAALQELVAEVESLKAEIAALKAQ